MRVLIENSLSMHGYVKGVTSFEVAMMRLLRQMHQATYRSTMSLSYINSDIYPVYPNASEHNIDTYITNVEPGTFGDQGDRANTNLRAMINRALRQVTPTSVVVLVSDMILSPGRDVSSADYLEQEKAAIQYDLQSTVKNVPTLSLLAIQLYSEYEGVYYVEHSEKQGGKLIKNKPLFGRMTRPYYVWILGPRTNVATVASQLRVDELRANGLRNIGMITAPPSSAKVLTSTVVSRRGVSKGRSKYRGEYVVNRSEGNLVDRVKLDRKDGVVDWFADAELPPGMRFIKDTVRVRNLTSNHRAILVSAEKQTTTSMRLMLSSTWERSYVASATVRLRVEQMMPTWFVEAGNVDDRATLTNQRTMSTTFGLGSLMAGVWAALGGANPLLGYSEIELQE
ncbi:MAG: hypothetical protein FGM24_08660 [Candidatus Kapabacteria bacterium]|nr:hypothetical protein [Candidatus Kapabacteria bacterium]